MSSPRRRGAERPTAWSSSVRREVSTVTFDLCWLGDQHMLMRLTIASKIALLGSLFFAQGLAFGFFAQSVSVLLRKAAYSLGSIGLASLLALPWALKFVWAPAVDARGSRRTWILTMQAVTAVLLAVLAIIGTWSGASMTPLLVAALLI